MFKNSINKIINFIDTTESFIIVCAVCATVIAFYIAGNL